MAGGIPHLLIFGGLLFARKKNVCYVGYRVVLLLYRSSNTLESVHMEAEESKG